MQESKLKMSRLIKRNDDQHLFDLEFWQKLSTTGRFRATWEMVVNYELSRGKRIAELRLNRSVTTLKRRSNFI